MREIQIGNPGKLQWTMQRNSNGHSRETGNIEYTRHRTMTKNKQKSKKKTTTTNPQPKKTQKQTNKQTTQPTNQQLKNKKKHSTTILNDCQHGPRGEHMCSINNFVLCLFESCRFKKYLFTAILIYLLASYCQMRMTTSLSHPHQKSLYNLTHMESKTTQVFLS